MPNCGSQIILCDLPIRFDTYKGCSHGCKYCFVTRKIDINNIEIGETAKQLENFVAGKRNEETAWCDWDIPLHWGGVSDPFQPIELKHRISLECLKVFAKTKYPFVVSTKNTTILSRPEYLDVLSQCNAVVQISAVAPIFDTIEPGAPKFNERIEAISTISKHCKRVIIRIQPYIREAKPYILSSLAQYKANGVYGVTVEGIKYFSKKKGFIKLGGDYVYPTEILQGDFMQIKDECHKNGLKFFSAENRLRSMGDDMCCCGIMGLENFKTNTANLVHYLKYGKIEYTDNMKINNQGSMAFKAMCQETISTSALKNASYKDIMEIFKKDKKTIKGLLK
jgi:DNA repair photolyase